MEKKTLSEFVINHIESDEHLSKLKEKKPNISTWIYDIWFRYIASLSESIIRRD